MFPDADVLVEPATGDRPPVLWQSLTLTVTRPERDRDPPATRTGSTSTTGPGWAVPAIDRHFEALDVDVSAVFPQSSLVALRRR